MDRKPVGLIVMHGRIARVYVGGALVAEIPMSTGAALLLIEALAKSIPATIEGGA